MKHIAHSACLVLFLALANQADAVEIQGKVVSVIDGDTIDVLDAAKTTFRIRLSGIDAPEKNQPFGDRSKRSLSDLVFSKTVTVDTHKRDRYGRLIGKVVVEGNEANLNQIKRGMAWFYRRYERELSAEDRLRYDEFEREAKNSRLGLWADQNPQPPWEWRKAHTGSNHVPK